MKALNMKTMRTTRNHVLAMAFLFYWAPSLDAGANVDARLVLDFEPENLGEQVTSTIADAGGLVSVGAVALGVADLDTLSFDIRFDPAEFAFEGASDRLAGGGPFLESNGGMQIGFRARVRPEDPTRVQVSATLVGIDRAQAPDGSGVLAVLRFRSLDGRGTLTPVDVGFLDSDREEDAITRLGGATVGSAPPDSLQLVGDCNQDGSVDISDAVCALGVLFLGDPEFFPCGDGTSGEPGNVALLDWQPDGSVDLSDPVGLLEFLFSGGDPHPLAGETPGCVAIEGCPGNPICP